jgi:hypothetical protein
MAPSPILANVSGAACKAQTFMPQHASSEKKILLVGWADTHEHDGGLKLKSQSIFRIRRAIHIILQCTGTFHNSVAYELQGRSANDFKFVGSSEWSFTIHDAIYTNF